ncbi:DUF6220 domain-containing protein [Micromonospora sp. CPCC 206061]|uniref:DUF6220 domain-containing protein n=1 Tax=Micromonospora sp. CPCC 206061 TaxID=3122410 RepID=UPI002FF40F85
MRMAYVVLTRLVGVAILVQFYFAAVGAFDRPQEDDSYSLHSINGMVVIPVLVLLATATAALLRAPGKLIGLTVAPLGLVVVQVLIIVLGNAVSGGADGDTTPAGLAILALHAVNGLVTMAVAGMAARRARELSKRPTAEVAPA